MCLVFLCGRVASMLKSDLRGIEISCLDRVRHIAIMLKSDLRGIEITTGET